MANGYVAIWHDWTLVTEELNDQEKGRLIDAIVLYSAGGDYQSRLKCAERYLFPAFREAIERERTKSAQKSKAGAASAEARKNNDAVNNEKVSEKEEQNPTESNTIQQTSTEGNRTQQNPAGANTNDIINTNTTYTTTTTKEEEQILSNQGNLKRKPPLISPPPKKSQSQRRSNKNPALNYEQRDYTDDYLDSFFMDMRLE